MIKIDVWMEEITDKLKKAFKENLIFIGLQAATTEVKQLRKATLML